MCTHTHNWYVSIYIKVAVVREWIRNEYKEATSFEYSCAVNNLYELLIYVLK